MLKKPRAWRIALPVMMLIAVGSGCTTNSVNSYCLISEQHRFTTATIDAMTDEEIEQVLRHNLQYEKLCL